MPNVRSGSIIAALIACMTFNEAGEARPPQNGRDKPFVLDSLFTAPWNDPVLGDYMFANWYLGAVYPIQPGDQSRVSVLTKYRPRYAVNGEWWTSYMVDLEISTDADHTRRPLFIHAKSDGSFSSGGFQLDEIQFNTLNGEAIILWDMADRHFYTSRYDTGSITQTYSIPGTVWSYGLRDDGQFALALGQFLNSAPAFTVSPINLQTTFYGPIRLANVASLPSASGVGAGTLVWYDSQIAVSNGTGWSTVDSSALSAGATAAAVAREPGKPAGSEVITSSSDEISSTASTSTSHESALQALTPMADPIQTQLDALGGDVKRATGGVAAAMALGGTMMPPDTKFAVSFNLATFAGERGFAGSAVGRVSKHVWVNAGIAGSTAKNSTGGRVGFTIGW